MMLRCAICSRAVALKPYFVGGHSLLETAEADEAAGLGLPAPARSIGNVCSEECGTLLWATYFERVAEGTADQKALTAWFVRQRVAEVNGVPFNEKPPQSDAERQIERTITEKGLTEIARELE